MRKAVRQINRGVVSRVVTLPAPVGGWNARDALGAMAPTDAVYLVNWFPGTSSVEVRSGYTQFATGLLAQVETVMSYAGGSSNKLFGIAGGKIYDATAGGAVGAAAVSGLTNSRFQYINVSTSGGNFLLAVNGANKLRGYSGSAWWADGDGTHDITGINTETVGNIALHKNRVWLIENNTLNVWYLPTDAIAGAASAFSLKGVARKGGYVVAMGAWTMDAGYGMDDMAVFVTSQGEAIVYNGTDPANAAKWSRVGVWDLGAPIGRRCLKKYAADLVLICQDGLIPFSTGLQSDRLDTRAAITDKISGAISSAIGTSSANFGWDITPYPKGDALILNVPFGVGTQQQYVMNSITKAWCSFTGWEANCFEVFQDDLYFGGDGYIAKAWSGTIDVDTNIEADAKQAFNFFGTSNQKHITMARPTMLSDGAPSVLCALNMDFSDDAPTSAISFAPIAYATWGTGLWGAGLWGGGLVPSSNWQYVAGIGNSAAIRMKTAAQGMQLQWASTDLVMQDGGIL